MVQNIKTLLRASRMQPPADDAYEEREVAGSWRGRHCVARRAITAGTMLLLEAPLATTRDSMSDGLQLKGDEGVTEWTLVHALLTKGYRSTWAHTFDTTGGAAPVPKDEVAVIWLAREHSCSTSDVEAVMEAVRHNAFGLETPVLAIEYGAAFYERAAKLNHDCDPCCFSCRLGSNMAVFTVRDVAAGEELTHSYLPPRLLVLPRRARRAHLHFACACERCVAEPDEPTPAVAALCFPPGHATTPAGERVARFKLLCATAAPAAVLSAGDRLISQRALLAELRARPLAALEIALPYLGAYWALRGLGTPPDAPSVGEALPLAAALAAAAAEALEALATEPHAPRAAARWLRCTTAIVGYLLDATTRDVGASRLCAALRGFRTLCGSGEALLRDDLPFLGAYCWMTALTSTLLRT